MKKIFFTTLASLFIILNINAQQAPMFTHYMYNTIAINPAYAGSRDALTITALNRSQWVGFDDAPTTQTLSLHSPMFNESIGLGVSVLNDRIGPLVNTSFYLDFSYKIKFDHSYLSFGLKSGINLIKIGLTDLSLINSNDPNFQSDFSSDLVPNFGVGIYYNTDKYYIGLSVPKIIQNNPFDGTQQVMVETVRHYFFIAGTTFNLSDNIVLLPTTFVKVAPQSPIEMDVTANFIFSEKYIAGLMYRTGDAAGVLLGINITPQLMLGYSFDWSMTNKTGVYNAGSHEIMLRYDFYTVIKNRIRSPRYF